MLSLPKFTMFAKYPLFTVVLAADATVVSQAVDIWSCAIILAWLFFADFATGIGASYCEWKKNTTKKDKWFFGTGEGFSSDKFKKMGVKAVIYMAVPFFFVKFSNTFHVKNFHYESWSDAEFSLPTVFILLFCANEGFSIIHENLPKMGFSAYKRIKNVARVYRSTKKEFTSDDTDENPIP